MDVATPTEDCLSLVEELLQPLIMKQTGRGSLSRQEVKGYHLEVISFYSHNRMTPDGLLTILSTRVACYWR